MKSEPEAIPSRHRRRFLAASASAIALSPAAFSVPALARPMQRPADVDATASPSPQGGDDSRIRPFTVRVPEADIVDHKRRIGATRWPSRELVTDASQGVQLATVRELARHWQSSYNWGKLEAKLNAFPQFMTTIDGVDIHFSTSDPGTAMRCQ